MWVAGDGENHMSTEQKGSSGPTVQTDVSEPTETADDADAVPEEQKSVEEELSLDLLFEVLKNSRRREVIRYLREEGEQTTLSDVAEHIAALENDTDVRSLTSSQRKRVYVGLYQCHLPKMADMGVVEFDQNRGTLELGPNAEQLYEYLDDEDETTRAWHSYYLGLSGVGVVLFALAVGIGGGAPTVALGALTTAVGVCAGWQTMLERDTEDDD